MFFQLLMRFKKIPQMATKVSNHIFGLTVRIHQLHAISLSLLVQFTTLFNCTCSQFRSG